ncbi:MAG TPA: hypothetical protein PKM41_12935 [Deltaproteobacteria bacterium]|jgi:predicted peptidase|nr:hypothetical protein [Deltaproteobacteria bacterium]HOI07887.1 hypothetical protein [Deltaproteobacteria bacterium]
MSGYDPCLVEAEPLRYLLSLPSGRGAKEGLPVLCFLHGYDEAAPQNITTALTRHGPLRKGGAKGASGGFIVIAPQLPFAGDIWYRFADDVRRIVDDVRVRYGGDPSRTYLTGFSFGGNGVFDLALVQYDLWAALWPVDPTRMPDSDPGRPVWLSFGEVSRRYKNGFIKVLGLKPADDRPEGPRLYLDQGEDHVGSAALAYRDERIYRWLLSQRLSV